MVQYSRSQTPTRSRPQPQSHRLRSWQKLGRILGRRPWAILLGMAIAGGTLGLCLWLDPGQETQLAVTYLERSLYGAAGLLLGTLLAASGAVWVDQRDCRIATVEDAQRQLQLPLLGAIPCCSRTYGTAYSLGVQKQRLDSFEMFNPTDVLRGLGRGRSPVARAYRFLQANLQFLQLRQPQLKILMVTSAAPREGKSTIAAGIARALAQRQHRVLLVDTHLHRPMQHRIWELNNAVGFSDVVMEGVSAALALHPVLPGLDLLTAGSSPASPLAVLQAGRRSQSFQSLCADYNFIILDSPDLDSAEASILGQLADGLLWVVRPGWVDRATVVRAKAVSRWIRLPVLGLVVNGVTEMSRRPYRIFANGPQPSRPQHT